MKIAAPFLREVKLKDVPDDLDAFPFCIPALHDGALNVTFPSPVTFFVGENGSGKSTLLEAIAIGCGFNPSGGSRNNLYDFKSTESDLSARLRLVWNFKMAYGFFLRAESFFNFATHIDNLALGDIDALKPYGDRSLHERSHGESFMALFENRFSRGIFLLDEPEAALSPTRQLQFLARLDQLVKSGQSQFIIATHSPILLSYPGATIHSFDGNGIRQLAYEDTEHFRVTKDFLNAHKSFYGHLGRAE